MCPYGLWNGITNAITEVSACLGESHVLSSSFSLLAISNGEGIVTLYLITHLSLAPAEGLAIFCPTDASVFFFLRQTKAVRLRLLAKIN